MTQEPQRPISPFVVLIGARREEVSEGYARLALTLEERHTNPNGVMHGGVVTTLLDEALAQAVGAARGLEAVLEEPHTSIEMNASFMAAARPGDELVVEGRVLRLGRSIAFGEAEARVRGRDDLVAKGRFTFTILRGRR